MGDRRTVPKEVSEKTYTLLTIDGADHDGGTLYVLFDEDGDMMLGCAWPQPLERIAREAGAKVRHETYRSDVLDAEPPRKRDIMDFEDRMIQAIERGDCSPEEAYDHVRDGSAGAADRERDEEKIRKADATARLNAMLQGSVPKDISD